MKLVMVWTEILGTQVIVLCKTRGLWNQLSSPFSLNTSLKGNVKQRKTVEFLQSVAVERASLLIHFSKSRVQIPARRVATQRSLNYQPAPLNRPEAGRTSCDVRKLRN
jgi:hypothetical protein